MPVLGICRGMQLLNVAFGGTLRQHLPDELGHERAPPHPGSFDGADHDVRLHPRLARRPGGRRGAARHQVPPPPGGGDGSAKASRSPGISVLDDLPEAIEAPGQRFVLGVQWHPEADERSRVVGALVEQAGYGTSCCSTAAARGSE